ncbi:hypothetical protein ACFHW2_06865 [Actinomadura sp. LOL_016]|uniref:sialidase family protein n=1 Tax=unclassified Actinomadura TaxID=2626254 RepID=UPI003A7F9970
MPGGTGPPAPATPPLPAGPPPLPSREPWRVAQPKRARRLPPKLLIGAGAGTAAIAVVASAVLILGGGTDGTDPPPARSAGEIFRPGGAAATDGRAQSLTGVAAVKSTIVAVGGESDALDARGMFLVSTDGGRSFESARVQSTDGAAPAPYEVPRLVAGSAAGWTAIGDRHGGPAVWSSSDGRTWRREPDAAGEPFGNGARVERLIGTGNGFIAVGATSKKGDSSDAEPALWTSPDGKSWQLRDSAALGMTVKKGTLTLVDAASSGSALLVVGVQAHGDKRVKHAWFSQDGGVKWTNAEIPAPKGTAGLTVAGGEGGFLAVRDVQDGSASHGQAFISADAKSWTKAGRIQVPGYDRLLQLTATGQGYTAVAHDGGRAVLVHGQNASAWAAAGHVPLGPGQSLSGAAGAGGVTVVIGGDQSGADPDALMAVRDARGAEIPVDLAKIEGAVRPDHRVIGLATSADRVMAVGGGNGDAAVWSSTDGETWKNVHTAERPGFQTLLGAASGARGWVAVGADQSKARHPLVLTSADGTQWKAVDGTQAFGARADQRLVTNDVAAGKPGYVIVGTDGSTAATWYSTDLGTWQRGVGARRHDLIAPEGGSYWMQGVTAGSSGFVAVGGFDDASAPEGARARPAAWTSPNGRTWTKVNLGLPSGLVHGSLVDVHATGATLVAVGTGHGGSGAVPLAYISVDGGASWKDAGVKAPRDAADVSMTAVTALEGGGFAAVGTSGRPGAADVVAWSSPDGRAWTASEPAGTGLSGDGDQRMNGLAVYKGTLLAVGGQAAHQGQGPTLWSRPGS